MHNLAKKIADCLKIKVEAMGIENIEGQDLVELGMWVDIIKDIACYDKDMRIIKAMDKAEEDEEYGEDKDRKYYKGQRRDSRGRYMSDRGGRRGYEEPMFYTMTPDMMKAHDPEYWRDMDRMDGRMYYTDNMSGGHSGSGMNTTRNYGGEPMHVGRMENARRGYEETKMMQDGSPEAKKKAMESLEHYMKELGEDLTEMVKKMDNSEKAMLKQKLQVLNQKIQ